MKRLHERTLGEEYAGADYAEQRKKRRKARSHEN
jgi:hypothetical protein